MTGPQTLEIPPLHTTLETLTYPSRLSVVVIRVTISPSLRFSDYIHMLAGNKVNSRERSSWCRQ